MRTIGNYTYEFDRGVFGGYALYINGAYSGRTFGSVEEYTAFVDGIARRYEESHRPRRTNTIPTESDTTAAYIADNYYGCGCYCGD